MDTVYQLLDNLTFYHRLNEEDEYKIPIKVYLAKLIECWEGVRHLHRSEFLSDSVDKDVFLQIALQQYNKYLINHYAKECEEKECVRKKRLREESNNP